MSEKSFYSRDLPPKNPERERLIFEVIEAILEQRIPGSKSHDEYMAVFKNAREIVNTGKAKEFLQKMKDLKTETTDENADPDWMDMSASTGEEDK